jgi:uncharacterized protein YbjT (DUF2867 family)
MAADTRLQLVAGDDVGALAALAFDDPAAFSEPTELAGDDLAMAEVAATFARVLGRPFQYVAMPHESAAQFDPGLATLGAPGWTARATGPTSVPSAGCDPGCSPRGLAALHSLGSRHQLANGTGEERGWRP